MNGRSVPVLVFALACSTALAAPADPPRVGSPLVQVGDVEEAVTPLALDPAAYAQLQGSDKVLVEDFPLGAGEHATLSLERFEVLAPDATLELGTARGVMPLAKPDVVLLRGSVAGEADSSVFLALSPHGTNGYIETGVTTLVIADARRDEHQAVIYDLGELPEGAIPIVDIACGTDHLPALEAARVAVDGAAPEGAAPCRVAKIAVETDYEFTANVFGGDTDASAAYAVTLMGAVSEIYKQDLNVSFNITFLRVWESNTDPYGSLDGFVDLETFLTFWNSNMQDVDRHVAHLLSGKQYSNLGGVAYLPGVCNPGFGYGLSGYINGFFPYPLQDNSSQNWDLMVVGHELGHNFGGPHTHDQVPQVDGCAFGDCSVAPNGTIMSYCHTCAGGLVNIVLNFHPQTINSHLLPYLDTVTCDIVCADCEADCDGNGSLDVLDFTCFQTLFNAGVPQADFNGDGDLNILDFVAFQTAFDAGC